MRMLRPFLLLLSGWLLFVLPVQGQDLEQRLQQLAEKNAPGYLGPLATSVGMGLNSGIIKTAKLHGVLGFDVTVHAGLVLLPSEAKSYRFDPSELGEVTVPVQVDNRTVEVVFDAGTLYPVQEAPTVFGDENPAPLRPNESYAEDVIVQRLAQETGMTEEQVRTRYGSDIQQAIQEYLYLDVLPPGLNLDLFPAAAVRASVGLPMGTELTGHFVPATNVKDIGDLTAWGIGGRLSLDQFIPIPLFPLDIAAGAFIQEVSLGPVTASSYLVHAEISKKFLMFDFFVGAGAGGTTLSADYDYELTLPSGQVERRNISVELEGENKFRVTGGVRMALGPLYVSGEYTQGKYQMVAVSAGVSIR